MIPIRHNDYREQVFNLIRYIRAGKDSTEQVPADYYTRLRMTLIGKRLQELFSHDTPEPDPSLLEIEVYYLRWCQGAIVRLVDLADWKGLLERIAQVLMFYLGHADAIPYRAIVSIQRLWLVIQALKPR